MAAPAAAPRVLNVNVGVLGHVDCGKTSLVAALSTTLSTAALDKHPQSRERGITLDLGFSAFTVPLPEQLSSLPYDMLQFTLVDCPGHASLIRTIIGGAQIIDVMLLVVDVTKGVQTQTAECLVVGEVACEQMVVVLNKVDLLPEANRAKLVSKARRRLKETLALTKFAGCPMVAVAARPGGKDDGGGGGSCATGMEELVQALLDFVPSQPRGAESLPLLFASDHCFAIRGQGTVLTGTVLQGCVKVGDTVELPELRLQRKVKSIQMFKRPVTQAVKGDRVGLCVTQLDAGLLERGIAAAPGTVPTFSGAVVAVEKIRFYLGRVLSRSKLHLSIGHVTVMGEVSFFGLPDAQGLDATDAVAMLARQTGRLLSKAAVFDASVDYVAQEELYGLEGRPLGEYLPPLADDEAAASSSVVEDPTAGRHYGPQWALVRFLQPVTAPKDSLVIGARFDVDSDASACRMAFHGRTVALVDVGDPAALRALQLYRLRRKEGLIERRMPDGRTAVCRGMFKRETDMALFAGMRVETGGGCVGAIEGSFGKSGKFKATFPRGVPAPGDDKIYLTFKRYIFDDDKHHMAQDRL